MDTKEITLLLEKIRKLSWRIRILWGLGILIVAAVVLTSFSAFIFESDKKSGWVSYTENNSGLASNNAGAIAFDLSGRAWIGTSEGVSVFDGDVWKTYSANNSGLLKSEVREIEVDPQGRVWIGLGSGMNVFDGEQWKAFSASSSPLPDARYAWTIAIDPSDRAWIGTSGDGLRILDGTTWTILREENSGLANDYVNAIAFDRNGRAWIGTNEGISVYDGQTWFSYDQGNSGLTGNKVKAIAFDTNGKAWIGTYRQGVSVFDGENWKAYKRENPGGFAGDTVEAIAIDSERRPYILSSNDLRVHDDNWITYNAGNSGLAPHGNWDLAIDPEGRIWITSSEGVRVATVDDTGLPSRISQERETRSESSILTLGFLGIVATLCLVWLAIFLEDIGIPLAFLIAGLVLLIMTVFDFDLPYYAPFFFTVGCLLGGVFGGIAGGVVRKLTKRGKAISLILTIIVAIVGTFWGFAFTAFSAMGF